MARLDSCARVANNPCVIRSVAAAALVILVPLGTLVAPFVHAHADDHHSSHHDGGRVHAHLAPHVPSAPSHHTDTSITEDDAEHALNVPLFVAVETVMFKVLLLVPARFALAAPAAPVLSSRPRVAHAHDPPVLGSLQTRAPPAFPS